MFSWAESNNSKTVSMTALEAVKLAADMIDVGNYDKAQEILTQLPKTNNLPAACSASKSVRPFNRGTDNRRVIPC